VRPELPSQVSDLVMAAMSRNPDGRPPSMESLEYELNKCLSGRGIAVAQILGMTTDANVVATLNAGLSVRNLDDGIVRGASRAGTHSGVNEMWETRSGISRTQLSGPTSNPHIARPQSEPVGAPSRPSGAQFPRPSTPISGRQPAERETSAPSAPVGEVIDVKKRGGMAVFGWVMLVLIIVGGIGAAAYVMFFKPPGNQPAVGGMPGSDTAAPQNAVPPAIAGSDQGSAAPQVVAPTAGSATDEGSAGGSADAITGSNAGDACSSADSAISSRARSNGSPYSWMARRAKACCTVATRSERPRPRKLIAQCITALTRFLKPTR